MDATRFTFNSNVVRLVAVSVERTGDCTAHAGIVYRDPANILRILHLASHRALRQDLPKPGVGCAIPLLEEEDETLASEFCGRIWSRRQVNSIPYAFRNNPDISFDPDGTIQIPSGSTGLNCATFVLCALRSIGIKLIDTTGWPNARHKDVAARVTVWGWLGNFLKSRSPDQLPQVNQMASAELHSPRIRPEEVAGACLEDFMPVTFAHCEPNGAYIRRELDAIQP